MNKKKLPFKTLRHTLALPFAKMLVLSISITPRPLSALTAKIIGWLFSILPLSSGKIIEKHRQTVMKANGINVSTSLIYSNTLRGFFDFFYLSSRNDKLFKKIVTVSGAENLRKALEKGKGVVAVTAHFGAWELMPRAIKLLGVDIGVVGRSLKQEKVSLFLDKLRQKPGIKTINRDQGASSMLRLLGENYVIGMLIDQDTNGVQSESISFLGLPALTPVAPSVLAAKRGIPLVTIHIVRQENSKYLLEIDEPQFFSKDDSLGNILLMLNERISNWIIKNPEQWIWFHDRWRREIS